MRHDRHRDSYARRLGVAALIAVTAWVAGSLLGPEANPEGEWYAHTGIEGDLRLLDAIEIVPDVDPITMREARRLPGATEGVQTPITERVVNEDNPDQVALERPVGRESDRSDVMRRAEPEVVSELQTDEYVEMNRASQQSRDFVLLHSVQPTYPVGVPAAVRQREIVVRVNMYVDESGRVTHAYVDRNDGGPRFERAVLEAVEQWVYRPLEVDGEITGFWDTIYFVFRVKGSTQIRSTPIPTRG